MKIKGFILAHGFGGSNSGLVRTVWGRPRLRQDIMVAVFTSWLACKREAEGGVGVPIPH